MHTPEKSRRMRFSLRAAFMAITVVALLAWFYWTGSVMWREARFERSVKRIQSGQTFLDAIQTSGHYQAAVLSATGGADGKDYGWIRFQWPNATYLLVASLAKSADGTLDSCEMNSVRVYRIPAAPANYRPQTARGRQAVVDATRNGESEEEVTKCAYWNDFLAILVGKSTDTLGFKHELIHSDPPLPTPGR